MTLPFPRRRKLSILPSILPAALLALGLIAVAAEDAVADDEGRAEASIWARAFDQEGEALADVWVSVVQVESDGTVKRSGLRKSGFTSSLGGIAIFGLEPGLYRFSTSPSDRLLRASPELIELTAGEARKGVELVLWRGFEIRGKVVDARDEPVADARVGGKWEIGKGGQGVVENGRTVFASTNADGEFRIRDAPPLPLRLEAYHRNAGKGVLEIASHRGASDLTLVLFRVHGFHGRVVDRDGQPVKDADIDGIIVQSDEVISSRESSSADGRFRFDAEPGSEVRLAIVHEAIGWSWGTFVTDADPAAEVTLVLEPKGSALRGRVRGLAMERLADVFVTAEWMSSGELPRRARSRQLRPDPDGRFELGALAEGRWSLVAELMGTARRARAEVRVSGRPGDTTSADLVFGGDTWTLRGRVLENDRPAANVRISPGSVETDGDGIFRIEGMEPGPYEISFHGPWGEHRVSGEAFDDSEMEIHIRSHRISGTLLGADGEAAPHASVQLRSTAAAEGTTTSIPSPTRTDVGGRFAFPAVRPGSYRLVARAAGAAALVTPIEVVTDLTGLLLRAEPIHTLRMRVSVDDGTLPERLSVVVCEPSGGPLALVQGEPVEGDPGLFEIPGVSAGRWKLHLTGGSGTMAGLDVTVPMAESSVTLLRTTHLEVRLEEVGAETTSGTIELRNTRGEIFGPADLGTDGDRWDFRAGKGRLVVPIGQTFIVKLDLADGRSFETRITPERYSREPEEIVFP